MGSSKKDEQVGRMLVSKTIRKLLELVSYSCAGIYSLAVIPAVKYSIVDEIIKPSRPDDLPIVRSTARNKLSFRRGQNFTVVIL